jgi:hypothetical protein
MSLIQDLQDYALVDPMKLKAFLWPDVYFYREQRRIIYSTWDNDQTFVPAGNMLGKDFTAGFIAIGAFITRYPCRIVTTSAKEDHLRVLWGEMLRYVRTCKYSLDVRKGGPLLLKHQEIERIVDGEKCPLSYIRGMVASDATEAAMQGHHCAKSGHRPVGNGKVTPDGVWRTLFIADECSSVPHNYWRLAGTWAHRMLAIGNTWPCDNFFKHAIKGRPGHKYRHPLTGEDVVDRGGDIARPHKQSDCTAWSTGVGIQPIDCPEALTSSQDAPKGYIRKIIHIRATDSPNVRRGLAQQARGTEPDGKVVVPGIKDWQTYQQNLIMLDEEEQCVSLNADFYEGVAIKLFPDAWLTRAEHLASRLRSNGIKRVARAIGIDPAEGGDKSAWCVVDEYGVIELLSMKTPDTDVIPSTTIALMIRYGVKAENVMFDRSPGKAHADRMRAAGYNVRTVGFGEAVTPDPRRNMHVPHTMKIDQREQRYAYLNRRAEMYGELSELLNPAGDGFALPLWYPALRMQLAPIPRQFDSEGRMRLPPKNRKESASSKTVCLVDLIGHSPDEADALVLAVHAMTHKAPVNRAGVA